MFILVLSQTPDSWIWYASCGTIVVTRLTSPQFGCNFFRMLPHLLLLPLQILAVSAGTVTYNWEVDWVSVSPDGHARPAVGINGQWPCPTISANFGDRVIVNVKNSLHNESTSIHFHGIFQQGSNEMDGPAMVTQCPIPPGECTLLFIPKWVTYWPIASFHLWFHGVYFWLPIFFQITQNH